MSQTPTLRRIGGKNRNQSKDQKDMEQDKVTVQVAKPAEPEAPRVSTPPEEVLQSDLIEGRLSVPPPSPKVITVAFDSEPTGIVFIGTVARAGKAEDIILSHPDVAEKHCSVSKRKFGEYLVKDYSLGDDGRGPGTFLNGEQLAKEQTAAIKSGDKLMFGTLTVVVEIKDREAIAQADDNVDQDAPTRARAVSSIPPPRNEDAPVSGFAPTVEQRTPQAPPQPAAPVTPRSSSAANNPELLKMAGEVKDGLTANQQAADEAMRACVSCGEKNPALLKRCKKCGLVVATGNATDPNPVVGAPVVPPSTSAVPKSAPTPPPATATPQIAPPVTPPKLVPPPPVVPPPPAKTKSPAHNPTHPDAKEAARQEEVLDQEKNGKSAPKPQTSSTLVAQRAIEKESNNGLLRRSVMVCALLAGFILFVWQCSKTSHTQDKVASSGSVSASTSSTDRTTTASAAAPLDENPLVLAPAPSVAPSPPEPVATAAAPAPATCKTLNVDLAKEYFAQSNLGDFKWSGSAVQGKPADMDCSGGTMHCAKGTGASTKKPCEVRWDLTAATCTLCPRS